MHADEVHISLSCIYTQACNRTQLIKVQFEEVSHHIYVTYVCNCVLVLASDSN